MAKGEVVVLGAGRSTGGPAAGPDEWRLPFAGDGRRTSLSWSADGTRLAFTEPGGATAEPNRVVVVDAEARPVARVDLAGVDAAYAEVAPLHFAREEDTRYSLLIDGETVYPPSDERVRFLTEPLWSSAEPAVAILAEHPARGRGRSWCGGRRGWR